MVGRAQEAHEICAVCPRRHRPSLRSCCGRLFREVEKNVCFLYDGELHEDGSGDRVLQQEPRGHAVASGEEMDGGGADAEYYMDHRGGAADRESGEIRGRRRRTDLPRLWRGAVHISDRAQEGRRGSVPDYVAFRQDEHLPEAYPLSHPARRMDPFSLAPVRTPYPSRPLAPPREVAAHDAGANVEVGTAEGCEARRCGGDGGLAERQPSVVAGHRAVREHLEAALGELCPKSLQQKSIGEHPAGQPDNGDTGGAGAVGGRRGGRADHRGVEARGQVRDFGTGAQARRKQTA
mgnify:CR=1 FL=1